MASPQNPPKTNSSQMSEQRVESKAQPQSTSINQDEPCCSREEHVVDVDVTLEDDKKICRICHLSSSEESSGSCQEVLIQLGCHCREDLGLSHRNCAETWFKQKGNRICEICNKSAKNVRFVKDESTTFVMEITEIRPVGVSSSSSSGASIATFELAREGSSSRCKQSCNFVLACLVLAFLISTFLRAKLF